MTNDNKRFIDEVNKCIEILDNAIEMHDFHIRDPNTATPQSQKDMMKLMLDARGCILRVLKTPEMPKHV